MELDRKIIMAFVIFMFYAAVPCSCEKDILAESDFQKYFTNIEGKASYYAHKFHNKKTASGEKYDMYGFTAAHKKLPFGTIVKVTNPNNQKSVLVKINDRGPFKKTRILDLTYRAAKSIDALCTSNIEMSYFDFSKADGDIEDDTFIGYSLNKKLIVISKPAINFIDSTDNFEEVVNTFSQYEQIKELDCYIFVEAQKPVKNTMYYIGSKTTYDIVEQK